MTRDSGGSRSVRSGDANTERPSADDPLVRLRALCTALPEVTERPSHGEPTWFVRDKKVFVMYADHHHDDRLGFWAAAPEGVQQLLVGAEPVSFFRPPYVGHRGWLGVYLDVDVDWDRVAEIVTDAYRHIAPRRLVAELDRRESESPQGREVGTQ